MEKYLVPSIVLMTLIGVYVLSYWLAKKTPAPVDISITTDKCAACTNMTCGMKGRG